MSHRRSNNPRYTPAVLHGVIQSVTLAESWLKIRRTPMDLIRGPLVQLKVGNYYNGEIKRNAIALKK